jgi:hypothetical protein
MRLSTRSHFSLANLGIGEPLERQALWYSLVITNSVHSFYVFNKLNCYATPHSGVLTENTLIVLEAPRGSTSD